MPRIETWQLRNGLYVRRGREPKNEPIWPGVTRGQTLITQANSGYLRACLEDDRDPLEPLTVYSGAGAGGLLATASNGAEFHYTDFGTTRIALQGADQVVRGCKFTNTRTNWGSAIAQVDCGNANTLRALVQFNDIVNNADTYFAGAGCAGHDYTLQGNYINGYIDSFDIWNTTLATRSDPVNVKVYENLFDYMSYYWAATTGIVHPSDTQTHNEHGQWHNGSNTEVIGNTFHCRFRTDIGDQTHRPAGHGHALTMSFAAGTAHTWKINDNAIFPYDTSVPINFGSGPAAGFEGGNELLRNRFEELGVADAEIYLDALWTGSFGVGVPANVNAFMNMADPNKARDTTKPARIRRNV